MKILLIDTCGATGSVALADTGLSPVLVASAGLPGRSAAERLLPSIRALAASSTIGLESLDAVAVVHGPGSFTGVRVGLSAAKGICQALNLPLVAISRLAVLAGLARPSSPAAPPHSTLVHALLDAGRGEFYSGLYRDEVCLREALSVRGELLASMGLASVAVAAGSAMANTAAGTGVAGREGSRSFMVGGLTQQIVVVCELAVAESLAALAPRLVAGPTAQDALPLVLSRIRQRAFDDPATIDANYLRRSDAEIFARPSAAAAAPHPHATPPGTAAR